MFGYVVLRGYVTAMRRHVFDYDWHALDVALEKLYGPIPRAARDNKQFSRVA